MIDWFVDLIKLRNVVKNDALKNIVYGELVKKINATDSNKQNFEKNDWSFW